MSDVQPTFPVILCGEEYALRFDVNAQIGTVTTVKILNPGFQNINWWKFLDAPYDISDMVALLMHGINGARRFNGEKKFLKLEETQALLEKHFEYIYSNAQEIEDEEEAIRFVQNENKKLMEAIQDAARGGVGFRKKPRPKEQLTEST